MIDSFRFSTCIYFKFGSSIVTSSWRDGSDLLASFFFLTFLCVSSCNLRLTTFFPLEGF